MIKEIFHIFSSEGFLLVDFVSYGRNKETNDIDSVVVAYRGKDYELRWNDYDFCYEGLVDNEKGYIL